MKTITLIPLAGYLISLLLSQTVVASDGLLPQSMLVITASDKPLQHQTTIQKTIKGVQGKFSVYALNAVNDFEKKISQGLPANEVEAKRIIQQRLEQLGKDDVKQQLLAAYQALLIATRYKIDRYPAIIVDHQFVIYGVTDLKQAVQLYSDWKKRPLDARTDQGVAP